MKDFWLGLAGGLIAFPHCLGMCGCFVLHLSRPTSSATALSGQLLWMTGKLCTYTFFGALAGFTGGFLQAMLAHGSLQDYLAYASGGVIIAAGLSMLGLLPSVSGAGGVTGPVQGGLLPRLLGNAPPASGALLLGLATGCLPCPIVLAFLAYAFEAGTPARGITIMAGMGLGTMLALLGLGLCSRLAMVRFRAHGAKVGGIILLLLGITTMLRGTTAYHRLLGCPTRPAVQQAEGTGGASCCPNTGHGNHALPR